MLGTIARWCGRVSLTVLSTALAWAALGVLCVIFVVGVMMDKVKGEWERWDENGDDGFFNRFPRGNYHDKRTVGGGYQSFHQHGSSKCCSFYAMAISSQPFGRNR